jgi:hypothetical protein
MRREEFQNDQSSQGRSKGGCPILPRRRCDRRRPFRSMLGSRPTDNIRDLMPWDRRTACSCLVRDSCSGCFCREFSGGEAGTLEACAPRAICLLSFQAARRARWKRAYPGLSAAFVLLGCRGRWSRARKEKKIASNAVTDNGFIAGCFLSVVVLDASRQSSGTALR